MALTANATWLIAYDIRDPRRLQRVHRFLEAEAVRVQYSIFVTRMSAQRLGMLRTRLQELIDDHADDVRIYRIPERPEVAVLGASSLPEGVLLLTDAAQPALVFTR